MKLRITSLLTVLMIILCGCSFKKSDVKATLPNGEAVFHFIDVGQGDCILVQTHDAVVLIDAGTTESGSDIYKYITALGIEYIDCFIATHPHEDHLGGASTVLSGIDVGIIYLSGEDSTSFYYENFIDKIDEKNIEVKIPDIDCAYKYGDLRIKFLSPSTLSEDTNDNSLVTMIEFGETKVLFMGDAESTVESAIAQKNNLQADILKIGHHGSKNATSRAFLNAVNPNVCVIQCGKNNSYGHPHEETMKRLEKTGVPVMRTDESGTIILKTDGKTIFDQNGKEFPENTNSAEITYIGNKNSKALHCDDCPGLPQEKNRVYFQSREKAIADGYTPCKTCNP